MEQSPAGVGETIEDHFSVPATGGEAEGTQCSRVVGDEVLRSLGHPRQIAHAQLVSGGERRRDRQPRGVSQRPGVRGEPDRLLTIEPLQAETLGLLQVEAQQIATVVGHGHILTLIAT